MSFLGLIWIASSLDSSLLAAQHIADSLKNDSATAKNTLTVTQPRTRPFSSLSDFRPRIEPQSTYLSSHLRLLASTIAQSSRPQPSSFHPPFARPITDQTHQWMAIASKAFAQSAHAVAAKTAPQASPDEPNQISRSSGIVSQWLGFLKGLSHLGRQARASTPNREPEVRVIQTHTPPKQSQPTQNEPSRPTFWQCNWRPESPASLKPASAIHQTFYQLWVRGQLVLEVPDADQAEQIAQRLRHFLSGTEPIDFASLQPNIMNHEPVGQAGQQLLFTVDEATAAVLNRSSDLLAIEWINNLRVALGAEPLEVAVAQSMMYGLTESRDRMAGTASWYGPYFHGRLTATGEIFNQNALTAAHPSLPFDTYLKVKNLESGDTVIVRINDRGPYVGNRSLDLSREAARCLSSEETGVVPYEAVIMKQAPTNPGTEPQILARQL